MLFFQKSMKIKIKISGVERKKASSEVNFLHLYLLLHCLEDWVLKNTHNLIGGTLKVGQPLVLARSHWAALLLLGERAARGEGVLLLQPVQKLLVALI